MMCCIRVWSHSISALQRYERSNVIVRYRNMDCVGLFGLFGLFGFLVFTMTLGVHWIGSYLWWSMLRRCDGIEVRRRWEVVYVADKAIFAYWWHNYFGIIGLGIWVYRISWCNIVLLTIACSCFIIMKWNVIGLIIFQSGGGDYMIRGRIRCLIGAWLFGKGLEVLRNIHNDLVSYCEIMVLLSHALDTIWIVAKMIKTKDLRDYNIFWNGHKGWHMVGVETQGIITPVCFFDSPE